MLKKIAQYSGFLIAACGILISVGVTKNNIQATECKVSEHIMLQREKDKTVDETLLKLSLSVERLSVISEQLDRTCTELRQEIVKKN